MVRSKNICSGVSLIYYSEILLRLYNYYHFRLYSIRKPDGDKIPDGCPFVTVRANVRGLCCQCRGPGDFGPFARPSADHHAVLSEKQFEHYVDVRTRPVSAKDFEKSCFVYRHERQYPQKTRT